MLCGFWYYYLWKGDEEKLGGLVINIGIYFFDFLIWFFGGVQMFEVQYCDGDKVVGFLEFEWVDVSWFLFIDCDDLLFEYELGGQMMFCLIMYDGEEIEFSGGFIDLYIRVYEEMFVGNGFCIVDVCVLIEFVYQMVIIEFFQKVLVYFFFEKF